MLFTGSLQPKTRFMRSGGLLFLIISILSMVGCTSKQASDSQADSLPLEVAVKKAATLRDGGAFMLDVRTPEEWNEMHIPGAVHIPLDQLESRVNEVPSDQEVVVYCRSGNRSATGRDVLLNAGFPSVTSMAGGITDWQANGYPVATGP